VCFGLLHHTVPDISTLNTFAPFSQFLASLNHLSLLLSIYSLAVLLLLFPIAFQTVIVLTSFISSILLRCCHQFTL
jgi:hypothetical protein